jgi:hypothetical protein
MDVIEHLNPGNDGACNKIEVVCPLINLEEMNTLMNKQIYEKERSINSSIGSDRRST